MKRPTQSDVARLAGVSRATVSFVVNGKHASGISISQETRQRVLRSVEKLGYVINARAQSLRSGDTKTIGVLLPIYENLFFWQMLSGIAAEAEGAGCKPLLADSTRTIKNKEQLIRELAEQRVDGFILLTESESLPTKIMKQLSDSICPVVEISSTSSSFDLIHQDCREGTKALTQHLFSLGHRHISFIFGVEDKIQGTDRLEAYRQAFEEADLPFDERWIFRCGFSIVDGYEAALAILRQAERPTALLAINDLQGMVALRAATDLGLRVPNDVSIASFDNIPFAAICVPSLTTVAGEPEKNGRDAVQLLLKRLNEPQGHCHIIIESGRELIIRESTGASPRFNANVDRSRFEIVGGSDELT